MKWAVIACIGALLSAAVPTARAAEGDGSPPGPFGAIHPEVAARFTSIVGSPVDSVLGLRVGGGFGARAGASYLGFYGGLSFLDLMSESQCPTSFTQSCSTTQRLSYGLEAGYGRTFYRLLLIRGLLGVGNYVEIADGTTTTCSGTPCSTTSVTRSHDSSNSLYLQPGLLLALTLGPVLLGVDANVLYMPSAHEAGWTGSSTYAAFMMGGQLGVRL